MVICPSGEIFTVESRSTSFQFLFVLFDDETDDEGESNDGRRTLFNPSNVLTSPHERRNYDGSLGSSSVLVKRKQAFIPPSSPPPRDYRRHTVVNMIAQRNCQRDPCKIICAMDGGGNLERGSEIKKVDVL